jgi:hypothetical protein
MACCRAARAHPHADAEPLAYQPIAYQAASGSPGAAFIPYTFVICTSGALSLRCVACVCSHGAAFFSAGRAAVSGYA